MGYSREISKNCYNIQIFHSENNKIFPGAPPNVPQCFSAKIFLVGKKMRGRGGNHILTLMQILDVEIKDADTR